MPPSNKPQPEDRLILSFESPTTPAGVKAESMPEADTTALQLLFQTRVASAPYAVNHMRSFLHLMSLPIAPLHAVCDVLRHVSSPHSLAEFALAPAYLLQWTGV